MIEIVVNFDQNEKMFKIYESTSGTLMISQTLGDGFNNLNNFLLSEGKIKQSILEDQGVIYHFDSWTFQEIIKSNMSLLKRVSNIPSEFKNSASRFGTTLGNSSKPKEKGDQKSSKQFQSGKFKGFRGAEFGKSYQKFKK